MIFVKLQTDIIRFKKSYQNESVLCHVIYRVGRRFIQVVNHKALINFLFGFVQYFVRLCIAWCGSFCGVLCIFCVQI